MNKVQELEKKGLIHPPSWLGDNLCFLGITGSTAYGCASEHAKSDFDCYGIAIPRKSDIWTHLPPRNEIPGFGRQIQRFDQWSEHHIFAKDELGGKGREYDFSVYSIVKFFQLAMENNPNIVDILFLPQDCILSINAIGQMVRENRKLFLHKGCWQKFKGYAYSSLKKAEKREYQGLAAVVNFEDEHGISNLTTKENVEAEIQRRKYSSEVMHPDLAWLSDAELEEYLVLMNLSTERALKTKIDGEDWKFLYHVVRLCGECEQILTEGDLDLRRDSERLKAIRRGDWTFTQIQDFFTMKEKQLEGLYNESKAVPYKPDEDAIKQLLLRCLEHHYGSLDDVWVEPDKYAKALAEVKLVLERAGL